MWRGLSSTFFNSFDLPVAIITNWWDMSYMHVLVNTNLWLCMMRTKLLYGLSDCMIRITRLLLPRLQIKNRLFLALNVGNKWEGNVQHHVPSIYLLWRLFVSVWRWDKTSYKETEKRTLMTNWACLGNINQTLEYNNFCLNLPFESIHLYITIPYASWFGKFYFMCSFYYTWEAGMLKIHFNIFYYNNMLLFSTF